MQNIPLKGLIVIRDSANEISGLPLWSSYVRKASDANFQVTVCLLLHLRRDLPQELTRGNGIQVLECLDYNLTLQQLRAQLSTNQNGECSKSILFIDSVNLLIQRFGLPSTLQFLHCLANQTFGVVICSLTADKSQGYSLAADLEWKQLMSVCTTVLQLSLAAGGQLLCITKSRKKDGLVSEKLEKYEISKDFCLKSTSYEPTQNVDLNALRLADKKEESPLDNLPFDIGLNLKTREKEAKAGVQLPYVKAQEQKGLVGLNITSGKKIRAGGQILYTPDREDDLDDSDPDDDLMI
uniref:Elongator complex protein 5 n=1 Tax=Ditylenchus dipsaci TaxID=166011 RepID=A0A915EF85_9BILA